MKGFFTKFVVDYFSTLERKQHEGVIGKGALQIWKMSAMKKTQL